MKGCSYEGGPEVEYHMNRKESKILTGIPKEKGVRDGEESAGRNKGVYSGS